MGNQAGPSEKLQLIWKQARNGKFICEGSVICKQPVVRLPIHSKGLINDKHIRCEQNSDAAQG